MKTFMLVCFMLFGNTLFAQTNRSADRDRAEVERQLDEIMRMREEMMKSLLDDSFFNDMDKFESHMSDLMKRFQQNSMGLGMGDVVGEYDWRETEKEKILVLKVKQIKDRPLDIKIEKGQINIKGDVEKKEDKGRRVSKVHFERIFSIPDGVDQTNPQFENAGDELRIKFKKLVPGKVQMKKEKVPGPRALPDDRQPIGSDSGDITI